VDSGLACGFLGISGAGIAAAHGESGRLAGLIRSRRRALGLTQRDLALVVNVGERFIVDLESGKPTCQIGKALAAAKGVGIRLTDATPAAFTDTLPDAASGSADLDLPGHGDPA